MGDSSRQGRSAEDISGFVFADLPWRSSQFDKFPIARI